MLWDVYDTVVDAAYSDNLSRSFADTIAVLASYPTSTGDHGVNEPWDSSLSSIDNEDGRDGADYVYNSSWDDQVQWGNNCVP
jgi:hypothetical protein